MAVGRRLSLSPCGPFHRALSILATWQLASPRASDPGEKEQDRGIDVFYDLPL